MEASERCIDRVLAWQRIVIYIRFVVKLDIITNPLTEQD